MSNSKISDFLSPHTLEAMYAGGQEGILLVLGKKIITEKTKSGHNLVRLRVRDLVHEDNCLADCQENLGEVEVGDLRLFVKSICLNTPQWRRSLIPGQGMLVARLENLDTQDLAEPRVLPNHVIHPTLSQN